jgi:hypothetical protein
VQNFKFQLHRVLAHSDSEPESVRVDAKVKFPEENENDSYILKTDGSLPNNSSYLFTINHVILLEIIFITH